MPFKTVFMCPKIIEKLYFSSRLEYLSFGIEITFISVLVWEMQSFFCDAFVLSNFWTVLDAFSFTIS